MKIKKKGLILNRSSIGVGLIQMTEKWGIWVNHIFWLMKHYHVNITGLPVFKERMIYVEYLKLTEVNFMLL